MSRGVTGGMALSIAASEKPAISSSRAMRVVAFHRRARALVGRCVSDRHEKDKEKPIRRSQLINGIKAM
jgi:hypothetical protein